ncbi:MAG TPA: sugar ABC transporter ATP-binding protein [Anaeromyxobacteraceae bacterium]|nr:sugar ABC transporter ATP-binding protein [Anaeromyxobacteraceae bacterium]
MAGALLEMRGIWKRFGGVPVLQGVNLSLARGEVHALVGENGAGKSTLMKILMGIHRADAGEIRLDGAKVAFANPREALRGGIAMIHQELNPVLDMEVAENVFLGREPRRGRLGLFSIADRRRMRAECEKLLASLSIPIRPDALMRRLSVAEMQLVEIAKALSLDPKVIVMDEPTSAITEREVEILFARIAALRERGVSVIYISHKLAELFRIADRMTVLRDGTFVGCEEARRLDRDQLIRMMVGRELTELFPKQEVPVGEEVLSVSRLSWGGRIHDVSFTLRRGEILGIAGLVGAGRSETAEALFGLRRPVSGEVRIRGRPVRIRSPREAIRLGVALVTEDRKLQGLNLKATVEENISLVALSRLFPGGYLARRREGEIADDAMRRLRIKAFSRRTVVASLSGGNQQKVVLAKWLLAEPEIIVFDEPTRGIDVGAKRDIYLLVGELVRAGKAVVLISSEIPELIGLADRILVMAGGRITGELQRAEFTQERIMHHASQFHGA